MGIQQFQLLDEVKSTFSGLKTLGDVLLHTDLQISAGELGVILSCFVERLGAQLDRLEQAQ